MRVLEALLGAMVFVGAAACHGFNTQDGQPNNIVAGEVYAYASLAGEGFGVVDPATGNIDLRIEIPDGTCRVDDLAIDGGLLFALDASDGFLTVWSLADPAVPSLVGAPVEVPVGPFAGVAAGSRVVVVSGGTSELTVRAYDSDGRLSEAHAELDLDRGQPDVLLSPDGRVAYVSTHFSDDVDGHEFGITTLLIDDPSVAPTVGARAGIAGAGFTGGTANPANFPIESALAGDHLFVAHGGGLAVLDVLDPRAIRVVAAVKLPVQATSVDVVDRTAYVVGIEPAPRLVILDVSDASAPMVIETIELSQEAVPTGIAATANEVLIADNEGGVLRRPR